MYAYTYRDGDYLDVIDLETSHNFNSSTFTFDYFPDYFGNYSFDFYLNDLYLVIIYLGSAAYRYNPNVASDVIIINISFILLSIQNQM